jgi:hypothetical protein
MRKIQNVRGSKVGSGKSRKESSMKKADFREFYREAHSVTCLSEREKMLLGLAVAMTRGCEP